MRQKVCLGLPLVVLGFCCLGCHQKPDVIPAARAASTSPVGTDWVELWRKVAPFGDAVESEERLTDLCIRGQQVHAILRGVTINAALKNGQLVSWATSQPLSQADAEHVLAWISKCKDYGVCGFSALALPKNYSISIRTDSCYEVSFVVLGKKTPSVVREQLNMFAKQGVTPLGDTIARVTDDVFIVHSKMEPTSETRLASRPETNSTKRDVHPYALAAMKALGDTDLVALWHKTSPFGEVVKSEKRLVRLGIQGEDVFALLGGMAIYATLTNGKLTPTTISAVATSLPMPPQSLSQADAEYILSWISKCNDYGVYGFDIREFPNLYRISIRSDPFCEVCFVVLSIATPLGYRDQLITEAEQGVTLRGDAVVKVTDTVFVATERR